MSINLVGNYPIGGFNVGLAAGVGLIGPLLVQLDLILTGPFGLAAFLAELQLRLSAALALQVSLGIQVTFPALSLALQLQALVALQAGLAAALAVNLSPFSISINASLALIAGFELSLAGINLLLEAVLAVKLPALEFLASLDLSAGPFVVMSVGYKNPSTLASSIAEYTSIIGAGIEGIQPGDQVYGIIALTKSPQASVSLAAVIKTE